MKAMRLEMAFFDGDIPLTRAIVLVHQQEDECEIECERGDRFLVKRKFEEPVSNILIKSYSDKGDYIGKSAMCFDVRNSEDWEAIDLVENYQLCFKCAIVDCGNPDWATQEPIYESKH